MPFPEVPAWRQRQGSLHFLTRCYHNHSRRNTATVITGCCSKSQRFLFYKNKEGFKVLPVTNHSILTCSSAFLDWVVGRDRVTTSMMRICKTTRNILHMGMSFISRAWENKCCHRSISNFSLTLCSSSVVAAAKERLKSWVLRQHYWSGL